MRQIIFAVAAVVVLMMNLACNTVSGMGRDIERAGEKTQDASEAVKKKL